MPPLPATAAQALLTSVGNEARALFSTDNQPLTDPAGFLANPDAAPLSQQPAKQLGRFICRRWARFGGNSNNPAADRLYAKACGPYLDSIGEGVNPGLIGPPFQGGQCNEVYIVTYLPIGGDGNPRSSGSLAARGPIGGMRIVTTPGNGAVQILCAGVNASDQTCPATVSNGDVIWRSASRGGAAFENGRVSITNVVACGANNCGNPPPEYERPRPPITLPPITPIFVDLPDIGPIQVDVEINADGSINVESPTLNVEVNLGNPAASSGGGNGDPGDPTNPGSPGPTVPTGSGGEAAGSAPPGQELVGLLVVVSAAPQGANKFSNNPKQPYRGIGYVRMGYPGRLGIDLSGGTVISPQFFHAPQRGVTDWSVAANTGFSLNVTAYYRSISE